MADYYPLIARAVEALEKNTGENRRALYERARTALVAQLRGVVPALEEAEITRERLALEEAIRKIEAESARRAREEARAPARRPEQRPAREAGPAAPPSPPPPPSAAEPPPPSEPPARPAEPRTLSEEALRGFRDSFNDLERHPPPRRPERSNLASRPEPSEPRSPVERNRQAAPTQPLGEHRDVEPSVGVWATQPDEATPLEHPAPRSYGPGRPRPPPAPALDEPIPTTHRRPIVGRREIVLVLVLIAIGVLGAVAWWQRGAIIDTANQLFARVRPPATESTPRDAQQQVQPKIVDRITPSETPQPGAPVAQRVVLYEEDPNDPQGKRLQGTAIWSTEMTPAAPGRQPELVVRARVEVPERKMTMTWSLRRNTDPSLPASHTIEVMFTLPPDSPSGGIQNVPGVLMKQAEQTRGVPLAGLAVKVTPGYFLIGLSSLESDMQRNIQLLKERSWFDIPIVYANNRRAILAMEKGIPGEKAFRDAFAAWKQ